MSDDLPAPAIEPALEAQARWLAGIERSAARFRILSTLPFHKVDFWNRLVTTESPRKNRLTPLSSRIGIPDLFLIGRLLASAPRYDVVLLAGGERADLVYAAIAGLCPWIGTPHVIVDAHWQKSAGLAGTMQRWLLKLASRLLREVQPHSREEIEIYAEAFGIDRTILRDVPWSTSMLGHEHLAPAPGNTKELFILTGGHSFRDYRPLLEAAGELGLTLKIGISRGAQTASFSDMVKPYPNVQVHGDWSNAQYFQQMAACTVYALPISQGLTRSTADQSLLNAMYLGATVVASSSIGSRIYVRNGVNGFLVNEPSAAQWKAALQSAMTLAPADRTRLVQRAQFDARVHFNEHIRLGRTLDNVVALLDPDHRRTWTHPAEAMRNRPALPD